MRRGLIGKCGIGRGARLAGFLGLMGVNLVQAFDHEPRQMLLCFRQESATKELVVNLGSAARFYEAAPGAVLQITNYSTASLTRAFKLWTGLQWSVFSSVVPGSEDAVRTRNTVWVTRARLDPDVPSRPPKRQSVLSQGKTATRMNSVGSNSELYSAQSPAEPIENSETTVLIEAGHRWSYSAQAGPGGDFQTTWAHNVESTTPPTFVAGGPVVRSDLYEVIPSSANGEGTYLGYFEFRPDGSMTFHAGAAPPPPPQIASIRLENGEAVVTFPTHRGFSYRLRWSGPGDLTRPPTQWTVLAETVAGTGQNTSLRDRSPDAARAYILERYEP